MANQEPKPRVWKLQFACVTPVLCAPQGLESADLWFGTSLRQTSSQLSRSSQLFLLLFALLFPLFSSLTFAAAPTHQRALQTAPLPQLLVPVSWLPRPGRFYKRWSTSCVFIKAPSLSLSVGGPWSQNQRENSHRKKEYISRALC